ncbi:hypothetical protein [Clostridium arbusti]|uniref:hypothetical protein n=1 Tax=Clostridium arbusti TaxID=1137848 RepID=UPI0002DF9CA1|nr:hypothetical protein [Clostridium arbusti]
MKLKKLNVVRISEDKKIIEDLISKGFKEVEEVKEVTKKLVEDEKNKGKGK